MTRRDLGRANYKAYRLLGVTHLVATGEVPNLNMKTDFEQLSFRIFPPMFGFYFVTPEITLPAKRPFVYEELVLYPRAAHTVRIQDADGYHDVPIAEVVPPDFEALTLAVDAAANYCVFSWIGINRMMIAKCDAIVPAVYTKVFGPASYAECDRYVVDNGGVASAIGGQIKVVKDKFRAWINKMPVGGPRLIIVGEVIAPTAGWQVTFAPAVPQGINPAIKIMAIDAVPPPAEADEIPQIETPIPLRFEEAPPLHPYTAATIRFGGDEFTIGVSVTH